MKFRLRLLFVAFSVSFLLAGTLSAISYIRFSQLNDRVFWVEHSYKVFNLISALNNNVRELDMEYFSYTITKNDSFRSRFFDKSIVLQQLTDSLKRLTKDNAAQQNLIVVFTSDMVLFMREAGKSSKDSLFLGNRPPLQLYNNSKYLTDAALGSLKQMSAEEDILLTRRNAERITYSQLTGDMIKALSIVFGVLTLILFFILLREFRTRVLFQKQLQQKMAELAQSKNELEHIAYATSHDLQEPLRKILILTDRWKIQQKDAIPEGTYDTLERVMVAASKMRELVADLMVLTSLNDAQTTHPCALNELVQNAIASMRETSQATRAVFNVDELPSIDGHPDQLKLLFKNLLDNALKFSQPETTPVINISVTRTNGEELGLDLDAGHEYYCISIQDNGVGFDNKQSDKMFGIFRQLHSQKEGFSGKGTGLAICHRIMTNHQGTITAHGFPGGGATFKLYFPVASV